MNITDNEKSQMRFAAVILVMVVGFILIMSPDKREVPVNDSCASQQVSSLLNGTYNPFAKVACIPFAPK